jgi:hypothetical protein
MKYIITETQAQKIENISDLNSESDERLTKIISTLKNSVNDIPNSWTSKKREEFLMNKMLELPFVNDGNIFLDNKKLKNELKKVFFGNDPYSFNITNIEVYGFTIDPNKIYIIHEPFGSKSSPDFLFITKKGLYGLEDKSSKNQKITFNTGTPGGNKVIMYFDRKTKIIHLISGTRWNWNQEIENEFKKFTKDIIQYAKEEFKNRFGDRLSKMEFYARPMLVDKNKVKDLVHQDEEDVINIFRKLI